MARIVLNYSDKQRKLSLSSVSEEQLFPTIAIFSGVIVPTYYLVISFAVCVSLVWVYIRAPQKHLSRMIALDLSLIIMLASFVGSRLFHVLYENFEHYEKDPMRILYFWEGGFVYYGGALLASFTVAIYLYFKSPRNFESYFDLFAPVLSFAYILGRGACFLAGCCFGRYCDLPWAVAGRHPTQLYAMVFELGAFILILGIDKTPLKLRRPSFLAKEGAVFYSWIILHALGRLIMEQYRDDFRGPTWGLSISSWISLLIMILGVSMLLRKPLGKIK